MDDKIIRAVVMAAGASVIAVILAVIEKYKNNPPNDDGLIKLSNKLDNIAEAITSLNKNQLNLDVLLEEVLKIEGFDVDTLGTVFDYLAHNETAGKAFLGRNAFSRRKWIERFITQHGSGSV